MERNTGRKRKRKSPGLILKNGSNNFIMGTGIKDRNKSHDYLLINELPFKCHKMMMKKDYLDTIGIVHMNFKSKNLIARMTKMINRINRSITSIHPLAKQNAIRNAILVKKM